MLSPRLLAALALLFFWPGAAGQERPRLVPSDVIKLPDRLAWSAPYLAKCDMTGNVYLPLLERSVTLARVVRLSPEGIITAEYSLPELSEFPHPILMEFGLGGTGKVYLVGMEGIEPLMLVRGELAVDTQVENGNDPRESIAHAYIAVLDSSGKPIQTVQLEPGLLPLQVAEVPSGDLFVVGARLPDGKPVPGKPFAAIFSPAGRQVREVQFPTDLSLSQPGAALAIKNSVLETGPEGNLYLMRRTDEGPIFVIDSDGKVIRTIRITPPAGEGLFTVKIDREHLVAVAESIVPTKNPREFRTASVSFMVLDPDTGVIQAGYGRNSDLLTGTGFVCFGDNVFTFLAMDSKRRINLVHAKPEQVP